MQTKLSHFCDHFVSSVEPLLDPLGAAIAAFESDAKPDRDAMRGEMADLRLQVQSLIDKVAGQCSYVLIFGPLKSGKSTLMNAIAASYVSEVSSLPAYPCLVFVRHGNKHEFLVTNYNQETETFGDAEEVQVRIKSAHNELAQHIRDAEDAGEGFDPQVHFPAAIRRIDVRIPAKNLEKSQAVLVDTPGLYTRMRFGYDRMTRDFRNSAACAIFVVKSDTLFLEQVFEEFNQLLELFSRIFLVVNIDSTKQDLGPNGELLPSLEQADPGKIIKAFEDLAMPTPLRRAADDGRVRIYPVDLMDAAGAILRGENIKSPGFGKFQHELHSYLASTDYLLAFLTDSMQRAQHLVDEAEQLTQNPFSEDLRSEIERAEVQGAACAEELRGVADCRDRDWQPVFEPFGTEIRDTLLRISRDLGARVARDMSAAIETWFLSSHSLQWLLKTVWGPLIADYHNALDDAARRTLEQSAFHDNAGIAIDDQTAQFLHDIGIEITEIRQAAIAALAASPRPVGARFPLDVEKIPLRRGVLDVVAFRSTSKVRGRLFGPASDPDTKISARQKASKLGDAAKKYLNQFIMSYKEQFFKKAVSAAKQRYANNLARTTTDAILHQLQEIAPRLEQQLLECKRRGDGLRKILAPLEQLATVIEEVRSKVSALDSQFASTDHDALLTPKPSPPADTPKSRRDQSRQT